LPGASDGARRRRADRRAADNPSIRAVLCFGDSNTWGFDPASGERFPTDVRWPGVLRRALGEDTVVAEEGLPGRTAASHHPLHPHWTARPYLLPALESHSPLDAVVIMLGTNDVDERYGLSAAAIAGNVAGLAEIVNRSRCGPEMREPFVLLVAPPPLGPFADEYAAASLAEGVEKSRQLGRLYGLASSYLGEECDVLDAGDATALSERDGIHLDADGHERLGVAVGERLRARLNRT
jgi:lysophospholipase L1-like esterase